MKYAWSICAFALVLLVGCASNHGSHTQRGGGGDNAAERVGASRHGEKLGHFEAKNNFTLNVPEGAGQVRAWFAMPQRHDPDQTISDWKIESEHELKVVKDQFGNEFLYLELDSPSAGAIEIKTSFSIKRHEVNMPVDPALTRPHTSEELEELSKYLVQHRQAEVTDDIRAMARRVVGEETNPLKVGRLLYDAILEHVEYWVIRPGDLRSSGSGNATYTYEQCTGNCTDFHALYQALCVAVNLPIRTVYGGFFKGPLDGVDRDASYHCWLEIHAPNVGWVPLDVSIADLYRQDIELTDANRELVSLTLPNGYHGKDMELVDYYYGNLEERRVVWHEGRDLELGAKAGPVNFLPWSYIEIDGEPAPGAARKFTFNSKE
jgi:transglutaminase-like putative cysteine protease